MRRVILITKDKLTSVAYLICCLVIYYRDFYLLYQKRIVFYSGKIAVYEVENKVRFCTKVDEKVIY